MQKAAMLDRKVLINMHELQAARQIIEIVRKEMGRKNLIRITSVGVRVGALSGFNPEALSFGFEAAVMDTPLSGARLNIEYIPIKAYCRDCHKNFKLDQMIITCPACGSTNLSFSESDALEIDYIEGE
jgi:hydrogenase nickel incorporation protein HypA/HybF